MKKGLSLLQTLFVISFILKLMTFQPFAGWSMWWVFGLLVADFIIYALRQLWYKYGLGDSLRAEIDRIKYEKIVLRREIRKAKLEQKKKLDLLKIEKEKFKNNG